MWLVAVLAPVMIQENVMSVRKTCKETSVTAARQTQLIFKPTTPMDAVEVKFDFSSSFPPSLSPSDLSKYIPDATQAKLMFRTNMQCDYGKLRALIGRELWTYFRYSSNITLDSIYGV